MRTSSPDFMRTNSPISKFAASRPPPQTVSISTPPMPSKAEYPPSDVLHESMRSLQGEVSRMSRSMRSIVHSELEECMKAWHIEINQLMIDTVGSTVRSQLEKFFMNLIIEPVPSGSQYEQPAAAWSMPQTPLGNGQLSSLSTSPTLSQITGNNSTQAVAYGEPSALAQPLLASGTSEETVWLGDSPRQVKGQWDADAQGMESSPKKEKNTLMKRSSTLIDEGFDERQTIKKRLHEALGENAYNVEDLYSEDGIWQQLARQDSTFSTISLAIVALNVIWIGVDEDLNRADVLSDAPILSQVVNNLFCIYFTLEMVIKFMAFENKMNFFRDPTCLFDLVLVTFMVWETWIEVALFLALNIKSNGKSTATQVLRFLRLFRLTRVPRIIRLSRGLPELMILIKGMAAAMRSVAVIILFIGITIFVFGILFTELLRDIDIYKDSFSNVPEAMHTLFLHVLCGPDSDFMITLKDTNWVYYVLYLLFLFVAILTWMNMMIGVLCDVVADVSEEETDAANLKHLEHEIGIIAHMVDEDHDGKISMPEFQELMMMKEALLILHNVGVDVVALSGLTNFIFEDTDEMTVTEFCHLIKELRGSRQVTVKDLLDTRRFFTTQLDWAMAKMEKVVLRALPN